MVRRIALVLAVLLAGCGQAPRFNATDITGAEWGRDFHLIDHSGKQRQLSDFRGRVVVLFFGYTQCPDVCPTTLSTLREVAKLLGQDARRLQVLFVTLDPERDTPAVLAAYVPAFNPSFLGLYGDAAATAAVTKEFKIFYQKQPGSHGGYTIDHTAASYAIDPRGRLRLYIPNGLEASRIADDLRRLLTE